MNSQSKTTYDRIIALWDIQESLLQSYRNIFITAESILFSVATFTATTTKPLFSFLLLFIGIYLLKMWSEICKARGYDVWFLQWKLLEFENKENIDNIFTELKEWQNLKLTEKKQTLLSNSTGEKVIESKVGVRRKMESLPRIFLYLWILLGIFVLWPYLKPS